MLAKRVKVIDDSRVGRGNIVHPLLSSYPQTFSTIMNLELLSKLTLFFCSLISLTYVLREDPFEQEYPEAIENTFSDYHVTCVKFNRRGNMFATGCIDGQCLVWDFDTKGVVRTLIGHVTKVTSVRLARVRHPLQRVFVSHNARTTNMNGFVRFQSWSANGRFLLSSGDDFKCQYWDLLSGTPAKTMGFTAAVQLAQMHPRDK
jgi:COMPASS component SWD1